MNSAIFRAAIIALFLPTLAYADAGFDAWLQGFKKRAMSSGVSPNVVASALDGVQFDPKVKKRDRNQSEFTKTIWDYLDTAVSELRISNGRRALESQRSTLEDIEATYGVDARIITAIWGLESAYGTFRGSDNVLRSLSTLAYDARRASFFERQLISALQIIEAGDTVAASMKGSWAGAMGHTQFMPTSFMDYAVDWNKDGKRDIWGDDPRDALASTAAYLKAKGWVSGQPWGAEVIIPDNFDYLLASREIRKLPSEWAEIGILTPNGEAVSDHGLASVLLPAGREGAAFLIFDNFAVLETYNSADAYVVAVGHLADRIGGKGPLYGNWPIQDRALTFDERIELQERLSAAGFDTQKIDAKIGPLTINAVKLWQQSKGLVPDGYASPRLLDRLRKD